MPFVDPPPSAAWLHHTARQGFEVAFFELRPSGPHVEGHTTGLEEGEVWWVRYVIDLDPSWRTRHAIVSGRSPSGARERRIEADGAGRWTIDGVEAPAFDGCFDLDLESSALTNCFPARRKALAVGQSADAPAAYVRANDLRLERLEQTYRRQNDVGGRLHYAYTAPAFETDCVIVYDQHGLAIDYPRLASRAA
jgi:uncharacterized protein